jgi:glyoxylase-like metal-dependent hydrolase (beta-lactamase superfamily II)
LLEVLHTPGHTSDSIAAYIPSDDALYTADTVLGQGTAVFEDLGALITSLRKMHDFAQGKGGAETKLYPGHGPVVQDGRKLINTYIQHRLDREEEIVRILGSDEAGKSGPITIWTIVSQIYAAYPQNLWLPAAHSVDLHLKKLEKEGRVKHVGGEGKDAQWVLIKGP